MVDGCADKSQALDPKQAIERDRGETLFAKCSMELSQPRRTHLLVEERSQDFSLQCRGVRN